MNENILQVKMLGQFTLSLGENNSISDQSNRSKKLWLLLAYLIYNRRRAVTQDELIELLWNREAENAPGTLKTTLHRLRLVLDKLAPELGHGLISHKGGCYNWNSDAAIELDIDLFENHCKAASAPTDGAERLEHLLSAAELYNGTFLEKLSSEAWTIPIAAYYQNLYIGCVLDALPLLESEGRLAEAVALAEKAVALEPYQEDIYQHLIRDLIDLGEQKRAVTAYENLSKLLLDDFSAMPSEETRAIYRDAVRTVNDHIVRGDMVRSQLREPSSAGGCMICEYDFFKVLYQAEARAIARSGDAVHICLFTLTDENGEELPRRSLDRAMDNLQETIRTRLRKGDIASRCSVSQFIVMLPQANYENSCMVSQRIISAFFRQYPHSPAKIDYSVWPLEPNV